MKVTYVVYMFLVAQIILNMSLCGAMCERGFLRQSFTVGDQCWLMEKSPTVKFFKIPNVFGQKPPSQLL